MSRSTSPPMHLLLVVLSAVLLTSFVACTESDGDGAEQGPIDNAADSVEEGAEQTGEMIEEGAEQTGEALEDAAEETGEAVEEATEETGEALQGE